MIASTQIANTQNFTLIAILVLKHKRQYKLLKSSLLFKKIANFMGK